MRVVSTLLCLAGIGVIVYAGIDASVTKVLSSRVVGIGAALVFLGIIGYIADRSTAG